jgi:membrane protein DedA with SNARE-associated domain
MHAGTGRLNVILVGILAFLAAAVGDNIGFTAGHRPMGNSLESVGYLSGNHNTIYNTAKQYELDFAIAVGALLIAYIARRIYRSRKQPTATR